MAVVGKIIPESVQNFNMLCWHFQYAYMTYMTGYSRQTVSNYSTYQSYLDRFREWGIDRLTAKKSLSD